MKRIPANDDVARESALTELQIREYIELNRPDLDPDAVSIDVSDCGRFASVRDKQPELESNGRLLASRCATRAAAEARRTAFMQRGQPEQEQSLDPEEEAPSES